MFNATIIFCNTTLITVIFVVRFNLIIDKGHSKSLITFVHYNVVSPDMFFVDVIVIYINYLLAVFCPWLQLATISLWLQEIHKTYFYSQRPPQFDVARGYNILDITGRIFMAGFNI